MQLFVNQLTNVDFSYLDARRGLVGETWLASAVLDGALDEQGMVCDFGIVKKTLRNWLDDEVDHRLVVPVQSERLTFSSQGDQIELQWRSDTGTISMTAPRQAVTLVDATEITSDSMSAWCPLQLAPLFPANVGKLMITFEPEPIDGACYHYSHGLKKHDGNCQRIAHGHRSRIHIWLDGKRSTTLEHQWSERWADIYIGSRDDITRQSQEQVSFAYTAAQGSFTLDVPESTCYLIDTDSTVEWIAHHIAAKIAKEYAHSVVRVQAFEGINKGAIVELQGGQ